MIDIPSRRDITIVHGQPPQNLYKAPSTTGEKPNIRKERIHKEKGPLKHHLRFAYDIKLTHP